MILGIGRETCVFLYAVLSGITAMAAYGILLCFRKIIPHGYRMMGVEDFVFWIGVSIYVFRRIYETTNGTIRWFFVLGALLGAGMCGGLIRAAGKISVKVKKKLEKYYKNR